MSAKKKLTGPANLEDGIHRLEEIVERLEQGDVPLEQAMQLYEEGLSVSKLCAEKLAKAELILKRLSKDATGNFTLADEQE